MKKIILLLLVPFLIGAKISSPPPLSDNLAALQHYLYEIFRNFHVLDVVDSIPTSTPTEGTTRAYHSGTTYRIYSYLNDQWKYVALGGHEIVNNLNDLLDVDAENPSDNDSLTWDTATSKWIPEAVSGGTTDLHSYMVIDTTGDQSITGTTATCNLDSEEISDTNYSLTNDEITFSAAGTYQISYAFNYDITDTSGGTRGRVHTWIEDDDSDSYAVSPGSYASSYHREASGGSGQSCTFILYLANANKKIRLRMDRTTGSTNLDTRANETSVSIIKLE